MLVRALATSIARQLLCACRASVAKPATTGLDIDVPESVKAPLPVPMLVETTPTPGAMRFGLSALSPKRGPPEVNEAGSR